MQNKMIVQQDVGLNLVGLLIIQKYQDSVEYLFHDKLLKQKYEKIIISVDHYNNRGSVRVNGNLIAEIFINNTANSENNLSLFEITRVIKDSKDLVSDNNVSGDFR